MSQKRFKVVVGHSGDDWLTQCASEVEDPWESLGKGPGSTPGRTLGRVVGVVLPRETREVGDDTVLDQ